jgi:hypothetical protein
MGKWLIVLPMLYATSLAAEPAWTWVDANGRRHYSDRPVEGATQVELAGAQGFASSRATPTPPAGEAATPTTARAEVVPYRSLTIVSPTHEETLWNIGEMLNVQIAADPGLQAGHRVDAYLDGRRAVTGAIGTQLTIPGVYRGLHTLFAVITDASGRELRRSPEVTFMVQQTSIQSGPANAQPRPQPPRPTPR